MSEHLSEYLFALLVSRSSHSQNHFLKH